MTSKAGYKTIRIPAGVRPTLKDVTDTLGITGLVSATVPTDINPG